jgi:transcriptional regulator with XRE-family HTH domain
MNMVATGAYLKALRNGRNLTQSEVAAGIGVSTKSLGRWENGTTNPGSANLYPLVEYLKGSWRHFLLLWSAPEATTDEAEEYAQMAINGQIDPSDNSILDVYAAMSQELVKERIDQQINSIPGFHMSAEEYGNIILLAQKLSPEQRGRWISYGEGLLDR